MQRVQLLKPHRIRHNYVMIYVCEATHGRSDHLCTLENIGLHLHHAFSGAV